MESPCPPPDPHPRPPRFAPPPGACDTHFHIFGPRARFPLAADRRYTPPEASIESYRRLMATLGIERSVVVQPSVYGTDNRCTVDALKRLQPGGRGIAVVGQDIGERELAALHAAGMRGLRLNVLFRGGTGLAALETLAARIAPLGWHVQLLLDGRHLPEIESRLRRLPVPCVIDHMGHVPASAGLAHPGVKTLLALLADGRCWVKLSGAYRLTTEGPPYASVAPLARVLIKANPDRVVWGSDWPHPALAGPMPNDGDLLDLVADWTADDDLRRKILCDNPAALYGFSPV